MAVTVNGSVLTQQALIGAQPRTLTWTSTVLTAGDVLVVVVAQNSAGVEFSNPAAPTGGTGLSWTTILDQQNTAAHFSRVTAWWSKIPSDQTSTITQVTSGTGANQHSTLGALYRLSGVDQVSPVGSTDGFQGQTDPTSTDLQLTGTKAGSLIFLAASDWSAGTASLTISISNTTSPVTDLNTLESGQFRGISARANQSSSTNQGTLDYSAATGDWAAIIFEIEAGVTDQPYAPLNPGWFVQQGLWRPIVGGVEAAAAGPSASGIATDTDRTSGLTTGVHGGIGATSGGTRVSGLTTGIKNAIGAHNGPQRTTGTAAAAKQATGGTQGQQHSSGATVGVKGSVGATAGQQRSSGLAVKGTPPAAAAVGQLRVSGATSGIKNATATTAIGQIRSSGATSGVHRAIGGAVGQLRSVGAVVAAKATSGATSGRQRTSGLVDTFVGIVGGILTVGDRAVVTFQPAGRATATLGTADRAAANLGTGDRATASLNPSDRSTATLTEADR